MGNRVGRKMRRQRVPKYGDAVFVPDEDGGDWVNGIVNGVADDGRLIVVTAGHSRSYVVMARPNKHKKDWCWPHEITATSVRRMSDEQHRELVEGIRAQHFPDAGGARDA